MSRYTTVTIDKPTLEMLKKKAGKTPTAQYLRNLAIALDTPRPITLPGQEIYYADLKCQVDAFRAVVMKELEAIKQRHSEAIGVFTNLLTNSQEQTLEMGQHLERLISEVATALDKSNCLIDSRLKDDEEVITLVKDGVINLKGYTEGIDVRLKKLEGGTHGA